MKTSTSLGLVFRVAAWSAVLLAPLANAQSSGTAREFLDVTENYFTAPLHWDTSHWAKFGGALALVAASHEFDGKVRDHFTQDGDDAAPGTDPHSTRDALPAAAIVAGTWAYAALVQDSSGYSEGRHMLEAAALSTVSAYALKFAAGRDRPNDSSAVDSWRNGGDSFPSLHATAAFAIGTVLAESGDDSFRWVRRGLGYGIALGTMYRRLDGNVHWLSDTVAGATIGIATAQFVMNQPKRRGRLGGLDILPVENGALLSWSMPVQ